MNDKCDLCGEEKRTFMIVDGFRLCKYTCENKLIAYIELYNNSNIIKKYILNHKKIKKITKLKEESEKIQKEIKLFLKEKQNMINKR